MQQMIGGQSDVGKLRRVAVKHARDAFGDAAAVDRQWRDLRYLARPDVTAAWAEYEHFLALLEAAGVDTLRLPPDHRSEEHTSELQSRLHLVCRLLLEK